MLFPLTWSNCLLKLLKMSCLLTWKTGLPSLKTACTTTPSEYMSEAESQLTDRMYSGARYSGLGRQREGRLGSHSLHVYLGWGGIQEHKQDNIAGYYYLIIIIIIIISWLTEERDFQQTSASEGLVEEMLKSKPMIFQDPLLLRMMFSRHKFPWTIFTPLWRKDKPSEI